MEESKRYGLAKQLDIEQILLEARHRWLRPAEICEILSNYKKFQITAEPANMPPSGSLFLFDRSVLRYFRRDGYNWRKKKDGKTVKEAHERLKCGSIDVLHCYYAHGEENENFQRRSYWMLEEELSHIVLVHYREVENQGNRTSFNHILSTDGTVPRCQEIKYAIPDTEMETSLSSGFHQSNNQLTSKTTDTTSLSSAQVSEYEDAESVYSNQASSKLHSLLDLHQPVIKNPLSFTNNYQGMLSALPALDLVSLSLSNKTEGNGDHGLTYEPRRLNFSLWEGSLENTAKSQTIPFHCSFPQIQPEYMRVNPSTKQGNEIMDQLFTSNTVDKVETGNLTQVEGDWQASRAHFSSKWPINENVSQETVSDFTSRNFEHNEQKINYDLQKSLDFGFEYPEKKNKNLLQNDLQDQLFSAEHEYHVQSNLQTNINLDGRANQSFTSEQSFTPTEGMKKLDSFNQWMSKELGDVSGPKIQSSSGACWDPVGSEPEVPDSAVSAQEELETYLVAPSLSHDQLFSIIDFSPNWAYTGSEIKVLVTGRFLISQQEVENCNWSCMFGELEVAAEIVTDDVLRCYTPVHKIGRVPFYVTCSNRLACSEVREFEFRINSIGLFNNEDNHRSKTFDLHIRLVKLLCRNSDCTQNFNDVNGTDKYELGGKVTSLLREDNNQWDQVLKLTTEKDFSAENVKDKLLQKLLKEKLQSWLLMKVAEGGKGPNVLDDGGQGVLHFAAALGYDWAIQPTIVAGVSVNFRDVNGWTALHWAAFCGRERIVALLVSLGAAPGALTDPSPNNPSGIPPADLASVNGHKGIAGYLAELALSSHLDSLNLDKEGITAEVSGAKSVKGVPELRAIQLEDRDASFRLSLKDSLAAVRNATQAAARIHQVFRVQSFQKKQLRQCGDGEFGFSEEHALSLLAVKSQRPNLHDEPVNAAAIRIQNKFRSWKGRKEFLIIRQRIVKIQAHVRGHQVRKSYRKIIWSVGILEKVILRWRRKGSGLRGFKPEGIAEGLGMQDTSSKEDDYDFLKEGRKQTEERLQKALARVKSMVQYPEARDQYRRLLNVVTEIQGNQVASRSNLHSSENTENIDDLIDLEALPNEDTLMPTAT